MRGRGLTATELGSSENWKAGEKFINSLRFPLSSFEREYNLYFYLKIEAFNLAGR